MIRTRTTGVILAAVCAFVASSVWYSPVLFGRHFLELSGVVSASKPIVSKVAGEMVRNLLLASAILWILTRQKLTNLRSLLVFDMILWIGFPLTVLSGSVMWQNVPTELALIHAGDWLIKILIMTIILWVATKNIAIQATPSDRRLRWN